MAIEKSDKILIGGASGMVGSTLVNHLLHRGYNNIHICARPTSELPDWMLSCDNITIYRGDVQDYFWLKTVFQDVEYVFNAAGSRAIDGSDREELIDANIKLARTWINLALESSVAGYVHISSAAALGRKKDGSPCNEVDNWQKNEVYSDYNKSKYLGEMEVFRGQAEGLNIIVLNPSTIIGPGGVLSHIIDQVSRRHVNVPVGSGGYVYVDDVVRFAALSAESNLWGEKYILNAGNFSHEKIYRLVSSSLNLKNVFRPMTNWRWRIAGIKSLLLRPLGIERPALSRSMFKMLSADFAYSNQKALDTKLITFTPIDKAISKSLLELAPSNLKGTRISM